MQSHAIGCEKLTLFEAKPFLTLKGTDAMKTTKFLSLGLMAVALSMGAYGPVVAADAMALSAKLSGANEVPANASTGSGMLEASFDKQTNLLTWTVTYTGMTGPVKAGHFHGPAAAGTNAGVAQGFTGSVESPIKGTATLTAAQAADLIAGKWYVNLHTAANPGGELRGQLTPVQ